MADLSGFDAAYPPANPPADQVVMGYLGGNTAHPWTAGEWAAQRARYRIGVWTRSNPVGAAQGKTEGAAAVAAWRARGAPKGTLIVLDLETAVNAAYVTAFDAQVVAEGFLVAIYGSKSTLFKNPQTSGGYFVSDLTNKAHLYPGTTITQYEFEALWDDDDVSAAIVSSLWDTQAAATSTTTAQGAGSLEEDDMPETIKPLTVYSAGEYAYDVPDGKTQLRFTGDGNQGDPALLRLAFYDAAGNVMSTIGDDPVKSPPIEVGGRAKHTLGHTLPTGCTGVTVNRKDKLGFSVAIGFHA